MGVRAAAGRGQAVVSLIAAAGALGGVSSCKLDESGKDHCLTAAECRTGNTCVAEICVPVDSDGAAWAPPLTYLGGVRRAACDGVHGTYVAAEAMRRTGFAAQPYILTSDPAFYAVGVNQDTRVVIGLTPSRSPNDFWFEVMATSQAAGPAAARWRDQLVTALGSVTLPCGAGAGPVTDDPSLITNGPPEVYYAIGTMATPTACGGFDLCSRTARRALTANGVEPGPDRPSPTVVAGATGDFSVAVSCADFGSYAVFTVFTSGAQGSGIDLALRVSDVLWGASCP